MISEVDRTECVKSMRFRTRKLEREGDYWTAEEKDRLAKMFGAGIGITNMALRLQRTEPAVIQQIEKLDLYERKANPTRGKTNSKHPTCLCGSCKIDQSLCSHNMQHNDTREEI